MNNDTVDLVRPRSSAVVVPERGSRRERSQHRRAFIQALPLLSPAVVISLLLIVFPFLYATALAFTTSGPTGIVTGFAGPRNFIHLVADAQFWHATRITGEIFVCGLVGELLLGLPVGYVLSLDVPGRRLVQTLVLLPALIATVAVSLLFLLIYDPTLGIANYLLGLVGLRGQAWLADPHLVIWSLVLLDIWKETPLVALIVSAGIRALPREPFEAAEVDGASMAQKALHIGLPMLRPVILVAVLIRSVDLLRYFDQVYVLTQGGPLNASRTLNLYGYQLTFENFNMSYGSAVQLGLLLIVLLVAGILTFVRGRVTVET